MLPPCEIPVHELFDFIGRGSRVLNQIPDDLPGEDAEKPVACSNVRVIVWHVRVYLVAWKDALARKTGCAAGWRMVAVPMLRDRTTRGVALRMSIPNSRRQIPGPFRVGKGEGLQKMRCLGINGKA
ncbi:hypothetical protein DVU_1391 [Nitratidesulfovibrio vulgaris str. Hildenborough]|uniref:Uncharacterized protein n=1 Tax=Nitratidesulfovibrio vulgaris (strain ATCC 29579 / DSM 644 / CCUG 34227 / NCIMB 8303 / VKM B-1760 / Hildenborough) TaxID=882 RepID=Q72C93_NITV2|nr:hypothetical protein DVU_1391 [Nitratidesulfovibrio vulgaris str. Hildenborough]